MPDRTRTESTRTESTRTESTRTERTPARAGRPRGSSRAMLEEAAAELFLEQGYAGTTVEDITRRAGVSRNTFFNYFPAKSDLLWADVDAGLAELPRALADCPDGLGVTDAVRHALHQVAAGFGPGRVPWALTQADLMGTRGVLEASGLSRMMKQADFVSRFVAERAGSGTGAGRDLAGRCFAMAVLAAAVAAAGVWAAAGVSRGNLAPYVDAGIAPACAGYRDALGAG
ncbi:TetR family transcriptional regulator [Cryobacterium sp. TMT1-2-1]|uniref:TetR family transcriptional regulator n=1 Tax=Cryobacterium sp. TMT1-2-1 TaxID=1259232 RepID=UPI00106A1894|nr:TetR family transcriptional regulator [Cryobacterium sp. TMT1-2-1]TFD40664.1 TetR family transcriptional regulator [Cryobacterium sp. TMT1-2-1]